MNELCKKGQIVFLGSTRLAQMDLAEVLSGTSRLHIYNRSVARLGINDVISVAEKNIEDLQPSKVFVNIGEEDLASDSFELNSFISKYEWLLFSLHKICKSCSIYIVPVFLQDEKSTKLNTELEKLAKETGCTFVKLESGSDWDFIYALRFYLRSFAINFVDAMRSRQID